MNQICVWHAHHKQSIELLRGGDSRAGQWTEEGGGPVNQASVLRDTPRNGGPRDQAIRDLTTGPTKWGESLASARSIF